MIGQVLPSKCLSLWLLHVEDLVAFKNDRMSGVVQLR